MTNLIPMRSKIIVKKLDGDAKSKTGLVLQSDNNQFPLKGKVLHVGGGSITLTGETVPMMIQPNDVVYFNQYAGQTIKVDAEEFLVVDEKDVLVILRG